MSLYSTYIVFVCLKFFGIKQKHFFVIYIFEKKIFLQSWHDTDSLMWKQQKSLVRLCEISA